MSSPKVDEVLTTLRLMMKAAEYCFVMTHGEHSEINARLMQPFEPDPEFTVFFGAGPDSRKVREIKKQNQVTVALVNPQYAGYATMVGTAQIETDPVVKKRYWRSYWSDMFPGGPDADDYVLIKFVPDRIEIMDFAEQLLPQPYWLKPTGLMKRDGRWVLMEHTESL